MCPQQYFLEYVLGHRQISNKKADKGTIVHKVLEICALCKQALQNGETTIQDEIVGEVLTSQYEPEYLDFITESVYNYYTSAITVHQWTERDRQDCINWVWKTLKYNDGMFDPRNRLVVDAEVRFDFEIDRPWSNYEYEIDGEKITGNLAMKGTIDFITELSADTYEAIDWKTGRRKDWATDEVKSEAKLYKDPQLRIYHIALKHVYPHVKQFIITINFINDGGPYSIFFDDNDIEPTLEMIRKKYEKIKNTTQPELKRSWKCSKLCDYGKTTFAGTNITPITETRPFQVTRVGQQMTKCEQIKYLTKKHGIDWVMKNCTSPGFCVSQYRPPGEV